MFSRNGRSEFDETVETMVRRVVAAVDERIVTIDDLHFPVALLERRQIRL
jgi:hypothetical protein